MNKYAALLECAIERIEYNWSYFERLMFTALDVQILRAIVQETGSVNCNQAVACGICSYEQAKKAAYLRDVAIGKAGDLSTTAEIAAHMRKMGLAHRRIGIQDLATSKIKEIGRVAVIAGITDKTFNIYNSKNYCPERGVFKVCERGVKKDTIRIETAIKPVLVYGSKKEVAGVAKIAKVSDKTIEVEVNKKYCRLCNRYVIVASVKRPEFHLGMVELVALDGTIVYVFAKIVEQSGKINYNMGTQRVYRSGHMKNKITLDLKEVTKELYVWVKAVHKEYVPANQDYRMIPEDYDEKIEDEIEGLEE